MTPLDFGDWRWMQHPEGVWIGDSPDGSTARVDRWGWTYWHRKASEAQTGGQRVGVGAGAAGPSEMTRWREAVNEVRAAMLRKEGR